MKINVIVPVYNSKEYIDRCINSILEQTYTKWTLFLVDDGSKDNSYDICMKYAKNDSRIIVLQQKNRGAGSARNYALDKISDDCYIVFVDSDDYIDNNYFELLSRHEEDVVFIDIKRRNLDNNKIHYEKMSSFFKLTKDEFIRAQMTGKIWWGGVRKAVKSSLILKNNIRYSNQKIGEEALYSFNVLYYAQTYSFLKESVYNYEVRLNSLSHFNMDDPWGNVVLELKNNLLQKGIYENYANTINSFLLTSTIISLNRISKKYKGKKYLLKSNERIEKYNQYFDDKYKLDKKSLNFKIKLLKPMIKLKLIRVFKIISKIFG